MIAQPSLFDRIPSGPPSEVPTREAGSYAAYQVWRETRDGTGVWQYLLRRSAQLKQEGVTRISVNAMVEEARAHYKCQVNNSWRGWLADDLIEADPDLGTFIERRRRRKAKVA